MYVNDKTLRIGTFITQLERGRVIVRTKKTLSKSKIRSYRYIIYIVRQHKSYREVFMLLDIVETLKQ